MDIAPCFRCVRQLVLQPVHDGALSADQSLPGPLVVPDLHGAPAAVQSLSYLHPARDKEQTRPLGRR